MSTTLVADAPSTDRSSNGSRPRATARRRSTLPSGRAVAGGLLVTLAALGTFLAATGGDGGPSGTYVVAAGTVDAGQTLTRADLRVVAGDLPPEVAATTYDAVDALEGATALAPLAAGSLIQEATVRTGAAADAGQPEISLRLPRAQAVDGDLARGERVDVLATYGTGPEATTHVVARDVLITRVGSEEDASLGDDGGLTLTLRLPDDASVLRTIHAKDVATVTLVRATAEPSGAPGPEQFAGPVDEARDATAPTTESP